MAEIYRRYFLRPEDRDSAMHSLGCLYRAVCNQLKVTSEQAASLLWFCYIEMLREQSEDDWLPNLSTDPEGGSEDGKTGGG